MATSSLRDAGLWRDVLFYSHHGPKNCHMNIQN